MNEYSQANEKAKHKSYFRNLLGVCRPVVDLSVKSLPGKLD